MSRWSSFLKGVTEGAADGVANLTRSVAALVDAVAAVVGVDSSLHDEVHQRVCRHARLGLSMDLDQPEPGVAILCPECQRRWGVANAVAQKVEMAHVEDDADHARAAPLVRGEGQPPSPDDEATQIQRQAHRWSRDPRPQ